MGTIIAAIISLAGVAISAGVSSSSSKKAMAMQESAWREEMEQKERDRVERRRARAIQTFEDTINKSDQYKKFASSLWSGRRAA
jgi:hypothetical protein